MDKTAIILEMNQITKTFPGVVALDGVTLTVISGEIHALVGENGAGKSTLMNILGGVYRHGTYQGEIKLEGEPVKFQNIRHSEEKGIAFIHQELALSPYLSIAENIFMNHELTKTKYVIDWNETNRQALDLMNIVGLQEDPQTPVEQLSVGKQQLVEIAKALSKNVKLLILDEPTAALTVEESEKLLALLVSIKKQGVTSILISHKLNELKQVSDNITIIRDGKVVETIRNDENVTENRIIRGMVGREIVDRYPQGDTVPGDTYLEVKHLSAYHPQNGDRKVINDVSFYVRKGEIVGLSGLMGAGRTEIAMSLFGRSYGQKVSADIFIDGKLVSIKTVKDAIKHGIAYLSEDRKGKGLSLIHSVQDNMTIVALKQFVKHGVINSDQENVRASEYRQSLNVKTASLQTVIKTLSGGNQQKVALAKWMMADPDILIVDEPTRGIDVGAKYEIYQIMNQLAKQGKAILFISSDLPEVLSMSDRIYVVNQGEIAGELNKNEISQESVMRCIMQHENDRSQRIDK